MLVNRKWAAVEYDSEEEELHTSENGYTCGSDECPCSWIDPSNYDYTLSANTYSRPTSSFDFQRESR